MRDYIHSTTVAAAILAVGMILAAGTIAQGVKDMRKSNRYVTVKGLVERDVVSNMALWPLKTRVADNDLGNAQAMMEGSINKIRGFLLAQGFKEEEVIPSPLRVIDRLAREYGDSRPDQMRYVIEGNVTVRSENVELVQKVSRLTNEIVRLGITLSQENSCQTGPTYIFSRLNEIKPDMLAEATKNARKAAEQFAADSGSRVGEIKQANQGYFSISERDSSDAGGGMNSCDIASDPNKKVRVVTTIDYYLE